jgi:hypothetical protein
MEFAGTLHIGNHCNNNYKLFRALQSIGVEAHFVYLERLARRHVLSDPRSYDAGFSAAAHDVEAVAEKFSWGPMQMVYELVRIRAIVRGWRRRLWIHGQTDFPAYVAPFACHYSAHSTGSDLRVEYARNRRLRRAYRHAQIAFYNNIDLYQHDVGRHTCFCFLPNAMDFGRYPVAAPVAQADRPLRILMPSRITCFAENDIKGNRIFLEALAQLPGDPGFSADLILSAEDPAAQAFARLVSTRAPGIRPHLLPLKQDRTRYLQEIARADLIADQFGLGALGGGALDCFAMGRTALVHLDPKAVRVCYGAPFPLPPMDTVAAIRDQILALSCQQSRDTVSAALHRWVVDHHDQATVARGFVEALAASGVDIDCRDRQQAS